MQPSDNIRSLNTTFKPPRFAYPDDPATNWARRVLAKEVVAGPYIRQACIRHLEDLAYGPDRDLVWRPEQAERVFEFFQLVLVLPPDENNRDPSRRLTPMPFALMDWQKFYVGSLYGWYRDDPDNGLVRRFRTSYCETAKGSGKTPINAGLCLYGLLSDGVPDPEIYITAVNSHQASMVFFKYLSPMVRASEVLRGLTRLYGGETNPSIIFNDTESGRIMRLSGGKDSQGTGRSGFIPSMVMIEEYHEHKTSDSLDILQAGFKNRREPMLLISTNAGVGKNSPCAQEHAYAERILRNEEKDDSYFAFIASLDPDDKPYEDRDCWVKANPSLPVAPTMMYVKEQVKRSTLFPAKRAKVLRLNFGIWLDQEFPWIEPEAWDPIQAAELTLKADRRKVPCYGGLDLSFKNQDLTALGLVWVMPDGSLEAEVMIWIPEANLSERARRDNLPYKEWADAGHINVTPGKIINYEEIAEDIALIKRNNNLQGIAYDPYRMEQLVHEFDKVGLEVVGPDEPAPRKALQLIPHYQTNTLRRSKTHSSKRVKRKLEKSPQLVLNMSPSIDATYAVIQNNDITVKSNPALTAAVMSVKLDPEESGNQSFRKGKTTNRIDAAIALTMAVGYARAPRPKELNTPSYDDYRKLIKPAGKRK